MIISKVVPTTNPYGIVEQFEYELCRYMGAGHAVAVDSGTAAIFLCLEYHRRHSPAVKAVTIPTHTFCGVANAVLQAGFTLRFTRDPWQHSYQLHPLPIIDSACQLLPSSCLAHIESPQLAWCLSFQSRKPLPIGRGGMVLTHDHKLASWLRKARWHGRDTETGQVEFPGWHLKMEPERAARGLELLSRLPTTNNQLQFAYDDLSQMPAYRLADIEEHQ